MGINVGAFICNFFGAALYIMLGWEYAFFAAGIGMFIGVTVFITGLRHYKAFDIKKGMTDGDMSFLKISLLILLPSIIAGVIGWIIPTKLIGHPLVGSTSTDAFIFACLPVIYFYCTLFFKASKEEKRPIAALLTIFVVVILFWAVFKQNGTALTTWADRYTNRSITNLTAKNTFSKLNLSQNVAYKKDTIALYDNAFRLQKINGVVQKEYNYPTYFKNVVNQELPKEDEKIELWATNLSQSINPAWVILLTPLIVAFFTWLRRKGKEPSTATKIIFGIFISAISVLVMVTAVYIGKNGSEKVSVLWLMGTYGIITIGELFLSPMGLSLVSKLSPVRITSLMMGGWFVSTSIGNKLSGVLATLWDTYEDKSNFFWVNFSLLMGSAVIGFALLKWLNNIMKQYGIK
jgi:POT family proton-dependent oligopeptide transporter